MEIITPNTYVIKFEEKDHKVIADCINLLREVTATMTRLNCEILNSRYSKIDRYDIEEVIDTLDVIRYAETVKEM
ncbi:MAG: hypothetical protein II453_02595 [Alphaproteobacteria bacterium]|nr:hypothetical protein [Alphaproteobacteria bacterium]